MNKYTIIAAVAAILIGLALPGIVEQAQREPNCTNEAYWLERGYDPLPESSCRDTDADAQPYTVKPL